MKDPNILKSKNPVSVSALTAHHGSAAPRVRDAGPPLVVLGRHVTIALKYDMGYNEHTVNKLSGTNTVSE